MCVRETNKSVTGLASLTPTEVFVKLETLASVTHNIELSSLLFSIDKIQHFEDYLKFWYHLHIDGLPILPIKVCLWIDSRKSTDFKDQSSFETMRIVQDMVPHIGQIFPLQLQYRLAIQRTITWTTFLQHQAQS